MPFVQVTILGGLPVIAEVSFYRGDGWSTDDDARVDGLYWRRANGKRGKPVSEAIYAKLEKRNPCWDSDVIEQASEQLAAEAYEAAEYKAELRKDDLLFEKDTNNE